MGLGVDVLGDVGVALAVASGRSGDLCRAGCCHPAAHGHVVAEDKGVCALDQLGEGLVYFSKLCGVGVDGVRQLVRLVGDAGGVDAEAGASTSAAPAAAARTAGTAVASAQLGHDGRDGDAQSDSGSGHHEACRDAEEGGGEGRADSGQHPFDGCADGADHAGEARIDGGKHTQEAAREAGADGFGRSGQRDLECAEHAFQGAAHLDGHGGDVAELAGDTLEERLPDAPRRLRQTARRVAENAVQAVHQREGIVGELLFLLTGQAAVEGGCRPLADAHPVAGFDGAPQGIDGAQHALAGPVFYLAPQAVEGVGGAVLDGLGHLFGAVGGDSLDGLHRAERPVDDLVLRLGDDLLLFGGAVREGLGHGLGGGLDPVHDGRGGVLDRADQIPHRLHGLADRPLAVRRDGLHGLDVLEHTVHHLTAGGGDGLLLLGRAVGEGFRDGLGGLCHAVHDRRGGVRDGLDDLRRRLLCAAGGFLGGACGGRSGRRRVRGTGRAACPVSLSLRYTAIVQLLAALAVCIRGGVGLGGRFAGLVVVVAVEACIPVFAKEAVQLVAQLIQPADGRTDGALGNSGDGLKRPIHDVAEGLAGVVGCHQPRRQSCQSGHHKPDGIGRKHGIQCRLCHLQTGSSCGGSFMGRSHRGGGSGLQRRDGRSRCHGGFIAQDCRRDGHDRGRQDADGLLERGHFGVVLGDGDDQLVCLDDDVPERREKPAGQFTGQRGHVVLQGGQPAVEGLAGLQHTVVELPALTGGSSHGGFQLIEADLAVRDALVEGAHAFASGVADLIERVEARVDHHVDVFQRDLLGRGHLAVGPHEGLELVRVAQRNITQTFQYAGGVVRRDAEL